MPDAVGEEGGRSAHPALHVTFDVPLDAVQVDAVGEVGGEDLGVEAKLGSVTVQIRVLQRLLVSEENRVSQNRPWAPAASAARRAWGWISVRGKLRNTQRSSGPRSARTSSTSRRLRRVYGHS